MSNALSLAADFLEEAGDAWVPQEHQVPPDFDDGDWLYWLLCAGRGTGKTDAGAYGFDLYMRTHPGHRGRIIAPTQGDAREACVVGPSGIQAHNPDVRFNENKGVLTWPNGSRARIFGAHGPDDVERLRAGGNAHLDWYEELAAWVKLDEAYAQARFGLRLGPHPRTIVTTTPRPRKLIRQLLANARAIVVKGISTSANKYLAQDVRDVLYATYQGTRLGRQELDGEMLEDVPGALWWDAIIGRLGDVRTKVPELQRVVVAVDPAVTSAQDSDETGIVVAGKGIDGFLYVLADRSCRLSPEGWARRAVVAYDDLSADRIVGEVNNGGDMVESTIRVIDAKVPFKAVHASRGKAVRAEPISALYEQGKVIHAEPFPELEDQMFQFTRDGFVGDGSPDRVDALVWALTELTGTPEKRGMVA